MEVAGGESLAGRVAPPLTDPDAAPAAPTTTVALDMTPAFQGGGIGRYARGLAQALLERGRYRYTAFVPADAPRPSVVDALGFESVYRAPLSARALTILWHRLRWPVAADRWCGRPDVFHGMDYLLPPLDAPGIATIHDLSFLARPQYAEPSLAAHLARTIPRSVAQAAVILADSGNTQGDLERLLSVAPDKIRVAYPGVDAAFLRAGGAEADAARARLALDKPYVLGVGTLEPRKNWTGLIAAFEAGRLPDHCLVLAGGRGWRDEGILSAIENSTADVRWLNYVPEADLPGLYAGATVFAYPSFYEGFGLPPLEAMAAGVATVVSDAPCLPEVVGDAARIVPAGDTAALAAALTALCRDPASRQALAARGRRRARAFTWDATAAAAEAAYGAAC